MEAGLHHCHSGRSGGRRGPYRSNAETQIARLFERSNICFNYEYPLAIVDQGLTRIWYPDFTLPAYGMIVEYFGRLSDPSYVERVNHKVDVYKRTGIEGLYLTEESFKGDWPKHVLDQIESILSQRMDRFRGARQRGYEQRRHV